MKLFIGNGSMKIVVTKYRNKKQSYIVAVVDGDNCIHKETVVGVINRDEVVWKLADLYGALDIEIIEKKPEEFKFSEIPSIPVLDLEEADEFFEDNQQEVYDRIIQAVKEGLHVKRDEIRLFELNGTGQYLTSRKNNWKAGLQQALDYFVVIEAYEKCITIKQLMAKL